MTKLKKPKPIYTRKEVIEILDNYFGKHDKEMVFTESEVCCFIRLFHKGKDESIIYSLADQMMDEKRENHIHSGKLEKKLLKFYRSYLSLKGNATSAAIAAGYSPKTARQAGYRALKQLQFIFRYLQDQRNKRE
jgi:hypothetical protein